MGLTEDTGVLSQLDEYAKGTVDSCGRMKNVMFIEIWERLRGYDKWIPTQAKIESSDISKLNVVTRSGKVANTYQYAGDRLSWVDAQGNKQYSTFSVDEQSPLYQYIDGESLPIRYDPAHPSRFYNRDLMRYRVQVAATVSIFLIAIVAFIAGLVWMDYHRKP